jgi:hypothetical protein
VSDEISLSKELVLFYNGIVNTLEDFKHVLNGEISNIDRKRIVDGLAKSGSAYRMTIYAQGFSGEKKQITKSDLGSFLDLALKYLDHSIEANKRKDGLYHAYNLMSIDNENEISISYLNEMLEGQVAALSSGYLSPEASLKMLDALKESKLFREDQYSYLLYPDKALPRFISKNKIPSELVNKSSLLIKLVKEGNNRIIEKDIRGDYHFNGNFNNANSLKNALNTLSKEQFLELVEKDKELVLQIFEEVFDHKSFTGRSGTFFGYEGLGSIYWHMVSKLLLAVQECCLIAIETQANAKVIGKLIDHYYEINEGIGMHKAPELYGAFPTDPYSHTPAHKGAQQPGMTGQVKEDILSRIGELGVMVKKGKLGFGLGILNKDEFLKETSTFTYVDLNSKKHELSLDKDSLCFTYCQIPIIYSLTDHNKLVVFKSNKEKLELDDLWLDEITTKSIFERNGEIQKLEVHFKS